MDPDILAVAQMIKRIRARNDPDHVSQECPDANEASPLPGRKSKKRRITRIMIKAWKTSRPWLLDHLPELDSHGWTRTKLFRAGRIKYPCGPWGVAFSRNWLRPDVQVTIEPDGAISWTWTEPTGKEITQASRQYL